ncbi:pre-peptidase C-terminal domain-containing protein [Nostoc sp. CHAB 5836]|uniref:calcium-binding protein n=1 Tax=Nostoc sp. CHAB 5836 TaxID=2780404 RepID=UPI001E64E661|nr:calcium-binding protein [Nostoc sp. CHAB 5836]MCC5614834.1 pre-peptidase C-terminal domain-containing protein [Nostoc sp. CHAB 5836]
MASIFGTTSPDKINGTSENDSIVGWASGGNANSPSGDDILNGLAGNDTLAGGTGNDSLIGEDGNDRLDGGTGTDTLNGGAGDDIYIVDTAADIIREALNSGTDIVRSPVNYTLSLNVENLTLTGISAINGTGNGINNFLFGNADNNILNDGGGNDTIDGNFGNDQLNSGDGNDSLQGGPGNDQLNAGPGDDILIGAWPGSPLPPGLGETDNLTGGAGADKFILGNAVNVFYDDNNSTNPGFVDLATITDFNSTQDRIELKGPPQDYRLEVLANNTRIFLDKPGAEQDEIIGVVQGRNNLRLDSDDFLFYERENAGEAKNNTLGSAEGLGSLSLDSAVNVSAQLTTVQPGGKADFDFFNFSLANSGTVTIRTVTSGDTVLGLFNDTGNLVDSNDDAGNSRSSLISRSLGAGTYSISVSKFPFSPQNGGTFSGSGSNADFAYTLEVSVV